jgi:uncharacterized protein (TIGR02001 family)
MRKLTLAAALCAASCTFSAHAGVEANIGLFSDYVFRGVSQTDEDPAPQAGIDWSGDSGWYVGAWASDVDFGESNDFELDIYGGYSADLGDSGWSYDVQFLYYFYPESDNVEDFPEVSLGLSYDWFSSSVAYTWDNYGLGEDALYFNLGGAFELSDSYGVHASIGYYDFDEPANDFFVGAPSNYIDWNVGVSATWVGFDFGLDYHDTDSDGEVLFGDIADSRVVFSISRTFTLAD